MTYEIQHPSPCLVRLVASVPPEETNRERQKVLQEFARTARIPGFRPGKAPLRLVEARFAQDIREETEERLLRKAWDEAVASAKLRVASPLGVQEARWEEDGGFRFAGEFQVYPQVSLPPLEGFRPPAMEVEPSEEEVEKFLQGLAQRHATWQGVEEGQAEDGMLVETEVEGSFPQGGGEPFREELAVFELGAGEVYPEIEAAVRGLALGGEAVARREVPKGDQEGTVPVEYKLKLKGLRRKVVPQVGDELARHVGVEGGLAALQEKAREALRRSMERERARAFREALVSYLQGGEPLPLPPRVVEEETHKAAVRYAENLYRQGVDVEKLDWKELTPKLQAAVEARLREELVLDQLASELGVEVSDEEVDVAVRREAQEAGIPFGELKGNLAKSGGLARIRAMLRRERAVAKVLEPLLGER